MARSKRADGLRHAPELRLALTAERRERAVQSKSGSCLVADAMKSDYPNLSRVSVDMATIRATDSKRGVRYVWLTPPDAQMALLAFDQGWEQQIPKEVTIRNAVQIIPLTRVKSGYDSAAGLAERRAQRRAAADAKLAAGEKLTPNEKRQLTDDANREKRGPLPRPSGRGRAMVDLRGEGSGSAGATIHGGKPRVTHGKRETNPNLLRGTDRHYSAKLADAGVAFRAAVDEAVAQHLAEQV